MDLPTTSRPVRHVPGRPAADEAAPYYFRYIDRIQSPDVLDVLACQLEELGALLAPIPEEGSLHRYGAGKWSIRELWSHVNDTERVLGFRAFWFARGFDSPLPSFDETTAASAARADEVPWADHLEEFRLIRRTTLSLLTALPPDAWTRRGVASDNPFSVRALAYIVAGHAAHHAAILRERYL